MVSLMDAFGNSRMAAPPVLDCKEGEHGMVRGGATWCVRCPGHATSFHDGKCYVSCPVGWRVHDRLPSRCTTEQESQFATEVRVRTVQREYDTPLSIRKLLKTADALRAVQRKLRDIHDQLARGLARVSGLIQTINTSDAAKAAFTKELKDHAFKEYGQGNTGSTANYYLSETKRRTTGMSSQDIEAVVASLMDELETKYRPRQLRYVEDRLAHFLTLRDKLVARPPATKARIPGPPDAVHDPGCTRDHPTLKAQRCWQRCPLDTTPQGHTACAHESGYFQVPRSSIPMKAEQA